MSDQILYDTLSEGKINNTPKYEIISITPKTAASFLAIFSLIHHKQANAFFTGHSSQLLVAET